MQQQQAVFLHFLHVALLGVIPLMELQPIPAMQVIVTVKRKRRNCICLKMSVYQVDLTHFSASDSHIDVANLTNEYASREEVDTAIKFGPKPNPRIFRRTVKAIAF
uniref:Uncharacterized protein n=1 Tax=Amphimedon queenslandica TaxID=400682 RepID=A0A1X7T4P8_AMPQE